MGKNSMAPGRWFECSTGVKRNGRTEKENWLLIKERDGEAKAGKAAEIVETLTDSVETGRGLKEVEARRLPGMAVQPRFLEGCVNPTSAAGPRQIRCPHEASAVLTPKHPVIFFSPRGRQSGAT